jgi:hypothetical protein
MRVSSRLWASESAERFEGSPISCLSCCFETVAGSFLPHDYAHMSKLYKEVIVYIDDWYLQIVQQLRRRFSRPRQTYPTVSNEVYYAYSIPYNRVETAAFERQSHPMARSERRFFAELFMRILLLPLTRAELSDDTSFLALTPQNPFVDAQSLQSDRSSRMRLSSRDTHFRAKTVSLTIRETGRCVPEHVCRRKSSDEGSCVVF